MRNLYNTFDFQDKLFELFRNDIKLCDLLGIETKDIELLNTKIRREDLMPDMFDSGSLDFIVFYFANSDVSQNYLVNRGLLRLDIYSKYRDTAGLIRRRCVELVHTLDVRLVSERQVISDITNVYKYRLEILPLIGS